jgi:hypothetical protein
MYDASTMGVCICIWHSYWVLAKVQMRMCVCMHWCVLVRWRYFQMYWLIYHTHTSHTYIHTYTHTQKLEQQGIRVPHHILNWFQLALCAWGFIWQYRSPDSSKVCATLCVCMSIYIYIYIYICIYIMHKALHGSLNRQMSLYTLSCIHAYIHIYIHTYTCRHMHT